MVKIIYFSVFQKNFAEMIDYLMWKSRNFCSLVWNNNRLSL